ncbi:LacI family DNA-binding transcriptional regulator [Nibricoccus aquaticus]|uniref:LacI family DNA-binding transcriptional regulator n=1 Tax=Nibricoccus aquaticus TaxID=2576891 RepID=UPI001586B7C9|nr:LacI family DNA-binding transcriptional regulator [Nibricoccus aquaticus]
MTQRTLAERCGVHPSTICLALRNSPAIPEATRLRVHKIAHELGYRPNVAARSLALLRGDKSSGGQLPLAWVNQHPDEHFWKRDPAGRRLLEACRTRAWALGYYLDEHWLHQPKMTLARLVNILIARGITGVLLPVHHCPEAVTASVWRELSVVVVNGRWPEAGFDEVHPDHFHNLDAVLTRLASAHAGDRRTGLALLRSFDAMSGGLMQARFLREQQGLPETRRIPVCLYDEDEIVARDQLQRWREQYRPELVLGRQMRSLLQPDSVTYWELQAASAPAEGPGLDERSDLVGQLAVDRLIAKIQSFERGPSERSQTLTIRGVWREAVARATVVAA